MKYRKECECCGAVVTAYTHALNKPLVNSLKKLVDFYEREKQGCNLQKDLSLTKNQYNNFQKLQYFNFVHNSENGWWPTSIGIGFIYGDISVLTPAGTFGKTILDELHEAWHTHTRPRRRVTVRDIDVYEWKHRTEYQAEKSDKLTLF